MSRAYEYWLHQQLEPNDKIRVGNAKRHKPAFIEKWEALDKMKRDMGAAEFARRIKEDKERNNNIKEYLK